MTSNRRWVYLAGSLLMVLGLVLAVYSVGLAAGRVISAAIDRDARPPVAAPSAVVGRLQHGALNDAASAEQDSFSNGLLDCPHYTHPREHALGEAPAILRSGNHAAIARWRRMQALGRTWLRRPELLDEAALSAADRRLLQEFRQGLQADPAPVQENPSKP
jgi:F0F1-type ATP synthase membrane subunit c/vacuolar-type H+-ATPase subunit K